MILCQRVLLCFSFFFCFICLTRAQDNEPQLAISSFKADHSVQGLVSITGEVKNISQRRLVDVVMYCIIRDSNKNLIGSDNSLLEVNPLDPNESSPFKLLLRYRRSAKNVEMFFKTLEGERIPYR